MGRLGRPAAAFALVNKGKRLRMEVPPALKKKIALQLKR
jgi:hypothetical protein